MFTRIFLIVVIFFSVLSLFFINPISLSTDRKYLNAALNQVPLKLELALTEAEWIKGLSNEPSLCPRCGMLFIFPKASSRTFVMRQMNFPLDIVWLKNNVVIGYDENLLPEANEPYTAYKSPSEVDMVLELPAGFVKNNNIKAQAKLLYAKNQ